MSRIWIGIDTTASVVEAINCALSSVGEDLEASLRLYFRRDSVRDTWRYCGANQGLKAASPPASAEPVRGSSPAAASAGAAPLSADDHVKLEAAAQAVARHLVPLLARGSAWQDALVWCVDCGAAVHLHDTPPLANYLICPQCHSTALQIQNVRRVRQHRARNVNCDGSCGAGAEAKTS